MELFFQGIRFFYPGIYMDNNILTEKTIYTTYMVKDPLSKHFGYDYTTVKKNNDSWFLSDIIGVDMFIAAIRATDLSNNNTKKSDNYYKNNIVITRKRNKNMYAKGD